MNQREGAESGRNVMIVGHSQKKKKMKESCYGLTSFQLHQVTLSK